MYKSSHSVNRKYCELNDINNLILCGHCEVYSKAELILILEDRQYFPKKIETNLIK